ncbi:hypothetical protein ScPMuIL_018821 [Solemya velum]
MSSQGDKGDQPQSLGTPAESEAEESAGTPTSRAGIPALSTITGGLDQGLTSPLARSPQEQASDHQAFDEHVSGGGGEASCSLEGRESPDDTKLPCKKKSSVHFSEFVMVGTYSTEPEPQSSEKLTNQNIEPESKLPGTSSVPNIEPGSKSLPNPNIEPESKSQDKNTDDVKDQRSDAVKDQRSDVVKDQRSDDVKDQRSDDDARSPDTSNDETRMNETKKSDPKLLNETGTEGPIKSTEGPVRSTEVVGSSTEVPFKRRFLTQRGPKPPINSEDSSDPTKRKPGPFPFTLQDSLQRLPIVKSPMSFLKEKQKAQLAKGLTAQSTHSPASIQSGEEPTGQLPTNKPEGADSSACIQSDLSGEPTGDNQSKCDGRVLSTSSTQGTGSSGSAPSSQDSEVAVQEDRNVIIGNIGMNHQGNDDQMEKMGCTMESPVEQTSSSDSDQHNQEKHYSSFSSQNGKHQEEAAAEEKEFSIEKTETEQSNSQQQAAMNSEESHGHEIHPEQNYNSSSSLNREDPDVHDKENTGSSSDVGMSSQQTEGYHSTCDAVGSTEYSNSGQQTAAQKIIQIQELSNRLLEAYNWAQGQITHPGGTQSSSISSTGVRPQSSHSPATQSTLVSPLDGNKLSSQIIKMLPSASQFRSANQVHERDELPQVHSSTNPFHPSFISSSSVCTETQEALEARQAYSQELKHCRSTDVDGPAESYGRLSKLRDIESDQLIPVHSDWSYPGYGEFDFSSPSELLRTGQSQEYTDKSPGLAAFDYSTPSQLHMRRCQREADHGPGYGEFRYSTPSGLLDRRAEREADRGPGYADFNYTTPSGLLHRRAEREADQGPGYGAVNYSTPSGLLHRRAEREADRGPGYGEFSYSSPSGLLQRRAEREAEWGPGYGALNYSTPSNLLSRREQRENAVENGPGYGTLDYSPPSAILKRRGQRETNSERVDQSSPGYGEIIYTTPSGLLTRLVKRSEVERQSPGYGAFEYSTPSKLFKRDQEQSAGEVRSPGYGAFDYNTPSKLFKRDQEQSAGEIRSPGYGAFEYNTPSKLFKWDQEQSAGEVRSPGYGAFEYNTPSKLFKRDQEQSAGEMRSPGYGAFEYNTPSKLFKRDQEQSAGEIRSPGYGAFEYNTPSKLFKRDQEQSAGEIRSPGYGAFEYNTPSKLFKRDQEQSAGEVRSPGYGAFEYNTPSKLFKRDQEQSAGETRSPGYGTFEYSTPSSLFKRDREQCGSGSRSPGYAAFEYSTPSELLDRRTKRELINDKSPGYGAIKHRRLSDLMGNSCEKASHPNLSSYSTFQYTTPSGLLRKREARAVVDQQSQGYGSLDYTPPSQLLQSDDKITADNAANNTQPMELQTAEGQSSSRLERKDSLFQYATPSQILKHIQSKSAHNVGREKLRDAADGALQYSTPSGLLEQARKKQEDAESSPGYSFFNYRTDSLHSSRTDSSGAVEARSSGLRTPSELHTESGRSPGIHTESKISAISEWNNLDFNTQSDVTNYFMDLAKELRDAASSMKSGSEPAFVRPFGNTQDGNVVSTESISRDGFYTVEVGDSEWDDVGDSHLAHGDGVEQNTASDVSVDDSPASADDSEQNTASDVSVADSPTSTDNGSVIHDSDTKVAQASDSKVRDTRLNQTGKETVYNIASQKRREGAVRTTAASAVTQTSDTLCDVSIIDLPETEPNPEEASHTKCSASFEVLASVKREDETSHVASTTKPVTPLSSPVQRTDASGRVSCDISVASGDTSSIDGLLLNNDSECSSTIDSLLTNSANMEHVEPKEIDQAPPFQPLEESKKDAMKTETVGTIRDHSDRDGQIRTSVMSMEEFQARNGGHVEDPLSRWSTSIQSVDSAYYSDISSLRTDSTPLLYDFDSDLRLTPSPTFPIESNLSLKVTDSIHLTSNPSFVTWSDTDLEDESEEIIGEHHDEPERSEISDECSNVEEEQKTGTVQELPALSKIKSIPGLSTTSLNDLFWSLYVSWPNRPEKTLGAEGSLGRERHDTYNSAESLTKATENGSKYGHQGEKAVLEKELLESQNRKLQTEVSTLETENKILKEKYNRATAKISELEHWVASHNRQSGVDVNGDVTQRKQDSFINQNVEFLHHRLEELGNYNNELQVQIVDLEKQLNKVKLDGIVQENKENSRDLEIYEQEVTSVKTELQQVKQLLEQSERQVSDEEERHKQTQKQVVRLSEITKVLQQQIESRTVADAKVKSLEQRLKTTEERFHQERNARADNLSQVEEKLLIENARLQSAEKELGRQLRREKDKCHNLEKRLKDARNDNDKLRMSIPFDEATLLSPQGGYDIPYGIHGSQRLESRRLHGDYKYIMAQIEKEEGLKSGQEKDIICELWSKKRHACHQLQELTLRLQDVDIEGDIPQGLKILREEKSHCNARVSEMEEKLHDSQQERIALETTYKEKLADLVREKHEAACQVKTLEDLIEAIRSENHILKQALSGPPASLSLSLPEHRATDGELEVADQKIQSLETKLNQLMRKNSLLEGEVISLSSQLEARTRALESAQSEVHLVNRRLLHDNDQNRKQQKIDDLEDEMKALQIELKSTRDRLSEKSYPEKQCETSSQTQDHSTSQAGHQTWVNSQAAPPMESSPVRSSADIKHIEDLEEELSEKKREVTTLAHQNREQQLQVQQARHDINLEQGKYGELEAKVESLQSQLERKSQMFDAVGGQEKECVTQLQVFRSTLDSLSQELSQTHAKLKVAQTSLSQEKDRAARYKSDLEAMKRGGDRDPTTLSTGDSVLSQRVKELDMERSVTKEELLQANVTLEEMNDTLVTVRNEMKQLKEELATEKTSLLHVAAEKRELEQHLEELAEEHDAIIQEKSQAEEDLIRLGHKLKEVLHQVELDAKQQQLPLEASHRELSPELKKLTSDMQAMNLVITGKDKELEIAQDQMNGHMLKIELLQRRVDLLRSENHRNREDIARLSGELALKVKESVASSEMNHFLLSERAKLQKENYQLEMDLEKEKSFGEERKQDIGDLARKVDQSLEKQKSAEKNAQERDNLIVAIESELSEANHTITKMEAENERLQTKLDQINSDLRSQTAKNDILETNLENHKDLLSTEKLAVEKLQYDLENTREKIENLRQEKSALISSLTCERQANERIKEDVQSREMEAERLRDRISEMERNLEQRQEQITLHLETIDQTKKDKSVIYQEYESLCRRLSEKEAKLLDIQADSNKTKDQLERDFIVKQSTLEKEKSTAEQELEFARAEITNLNDRIHQLDIQIATFGRTLQELEVTKREKSEVEAQLRMLESSSGDMKVLMESHRREIQSLQETNTNLQEKATKEEATNIALQEQIRLQKEACEKETQDLKESLNNLRNQQDGEAHYLQDSLGKAETRIHALECSLGSSVEARDKLQVRVRLLERTEEALNKQVEGATMAQQLASEKAETTRAHLEETRRDKWAADQKVTKAEATVIKQEEDLKKLQDKIKEFTEKCNELEAVSYSHEANAKSGQQQLDIMMVENKKLRHLIENQKQQLGGRLKKVSVDLKQQLQTSEEDHTKLSLQVKQLTSDLEKARQHITEKSNENLQLQEQILSLESHARESSARLKETKELLRMETEIQNKLTNRYEEQEDELKTLKMFLAKKAEEAGDADKSTWTEMGRLIQDLSRKMQDQLELQNSSKHEGKDRDVQTVQRYRSRLSELESELSTEKALHQITQNSLRSLEEDCQRLRHQLHSVRRRDVTTPDKKKKSRMEVINEIIARSQSQAQTMLASAGYYDGTTSPVPMLISPRERLTHGLDDSLGSDSMSPMRIHGYIPTTPPARHSPPRHSP